MALVPAAMQADLDSEIYNNLKEAMAPDVSKGQNYESVADAQLHKMATAIAKAVAKVVIQHITSNAMVLPGQSVVGAGGGVPGPMTGATVSPGQIK